MHKNTFAKRLFGKSLILGILTFGLFAVVPTSSESKSRDYYYWGAIAYSFSARVDGTSWDYSTQGEAANVARRACGQADCRVLLTFESECGAIAVGENGGWGGGYGDNHDAARNAAQNTCRRHGNKSCRVASSVCTTIED